MGKKFKPNSSKPQHSLELIPKTTQEKYIKSIEESYQTTFKYKPKELYINSKQRIYASTVPKEIIQEIKRVNSLGLYLGTLVNSGHIRLSVEGSQLLNQAKDNFILLKKENLSSYLSGENVFFDEIEKETILKTKSPFLLVYDSHYNALGTISKKEKEYLNYLSKGRKMNFNRVF